ncbi:hypothetical protein [Pandoraea sp. SD6-2]|uniref:hypothetical protein n=1 Tax=Pandoraea sp. SD6-2 TaxID=1286093 RepID=UPI0011866746|nr:hypothetical protein [Pandoraea sp. SD6-2]
MDKEQNGDQVSISLNRTINTYAELWHGAKSLAAKGRADVDGSFWTLMGAQILFAFSIEAYCNYALPYVFSNLTENRRRDVAQRPPVCRIALICASLDVSFNEGGDELNALQELFRLRNSLAHGRQLDLAESKMYAAEDVNDPANFWLSAPWEAMCTVDAVDRTQDVAYRIITGIHGRLPTHLGRPFKFGVGSGLAQLVRS